MLFWQGLDLLFYGDSITESWHGTDSFKVSNGPCKSRKRQCAEIKRVYKAHFSKYRSVVLGIGGE